MPPCFPATTVLTSSTLTSSTAMFPPLTGPDVAGWIYLNMNNGGSTSYSAPEGRNFRENSSTIAGPRQSQNWVAISMEAEGRFATEMDAGMLGNGCSPAPGSQAVRAIGPQPNENP